MIHFAQKLVDVLAVFLGLIDQKNNLGRAPQMQALDQFVAHEFRRGLQARERRSRSSSVSLQDPTNTRTARMPGAERALPLR